MIYGFLFPQRLFQKHMQFVFTFGFDPITIPTSITNTPSSPPPQLDIILIIQHCDDQYENLTTFKYPHCHTVVESLCIRQTYDVNGWSETSSTKCLERTLETWARGQDRSRSLAFALKTR